MIILLLPLARSYAKAIHNLMKGNEVSNFEKTYSPKTDAAIVARDEMRAELERQRVERRKSQVELIRLHFACAWREGLLARSPGDSMYLDMEAQSELRRKIMHQAWADADAFIKKGEQDA